MSTPVTRPPADRHPASVNDILTSGKAFACCYAGTRPDCQVLAVVRYGPIALCADCDQRRSSAGKATTPARLPGPDALLQVATARDACRQADEALRDAVARARQAGQPWPGLAAILGVTRQTAQQRFAQARPDPAIIARHNNFHDHT